MTQLEATQAPSGSRERPVPTNEPAPQEKREDLITLKPAIWGMGMNLNKLWRRLWRWMRPRFKA
jgi:hypothetical protein